MSGYAKEVSMQFFRFDFKPHKKRTFLPIFSKDNRHNCVGQFFKDYYSFKKNITGMEKIRQVS